MTIAPQTPVIVLPGDGSNVTFNYNFEIPYQTDGSTPAVLVQLWDGDVDVDPTDVDPSLYTITGVGVEAGGAVTYPLAGAPVAAGLYVIISRNLAYSQGSAFPNTSFQPRQIEYALDQLVMQVQQLAARPSGSGGGGGGGSGVASFNGRTGSVSLFSSDVTGALGFTPVNRAGDTMTGKLNTDPADGTLAGLNLGEGTDPASPVDGDIWATTTALKARINGATIDLTDTGGFDESTPYAVGAEADALLNLVQRGSILRSLFDYGALGDGTTDDTAAWNKMVADVNAGVIKSIFIPGFSFYIPGDTVPFTRGCDILGTGDNSLLKTANTTGTSILIHFDGIPYTDKVTLSGFKLACASGLPKLRQAIQVTWATEPLVFSISNISIDGGFKRGIGVHNAVVSNFSNVTINFYNYTNNDWGWNLTSDIGRYIVDLRFVNCNVAGSGYGIKATGHIEGIVIDDCVFGFCGWGVYMENSDTGGLPSPEVNITNSAMECIYGPIYLSAFVDVMISDNWFAINPASPPNAVGVELNGCFSASVHDNVFVGLTAQVWHGVKFTGASNVGNVHHNIYRVLRGYGTWVAGTSDHVVSEYNTYYSPVTGAFPFINSAVSNNNIHRGETSDSSAIQFTGISQDGSLVTTTAISSAAFTRVAESVDMPVFVGEQFRIQAAGTVDTPSTDMFVYLRIREYNHRPGSANPYPIFYVNFNRTSINDGRMLAQSITLGDSTFFYIDTVVRIIGTALDAKFILEFTCDVGTARITERGFWVGRL